jgi:hypothetical protein
MAADFERFFGVVLSLATTQQRAKQRFVGLSSCRYRCRPNGALSCGVLWRYHIFVRLKSKDWIINKVTGRQHDNAAQDNDIAKRQRMAHFDSEKTKMRLRYRLYCRYRQRNAQSVPNQPP